MDKVMDEANKLLKERGYLFQSEFYDLIKKYGKKIVIKFDEEKRCFVQQEVSDESDEIVEFIDFNKMDPE